MDSNMAISLNILDYLEKMEEYNASDLYLTVGMQVIWREEDIVARGEEKLGNEDIWQMARQILSSEDKAKLIEKKELNIAFTDGRQNRYRINAFFQQQNIGMVIRKVKKEVPTVEKLNLPEAYPNLIMKNSGLILVVGTAGSGKSTSIAAMLEHRNNNREGHIITIEDPVEYVHTSKKCIFSQRELGIDTLSWNDALKNALRQRPDIIHIGEIRDGETMSHAMNFAETGHLVIATLHSTTTDSTVERVVNFFPARERQQHLYTLSQTLRAILGQRLVTNKDGNRELAPEILRNEGLIRQLIASGESDKIKEMIEKNSDLGMCSFDQSLLKLFLDGKITKEVALNASDSPDNMNLEMMKHHAQVNNSFSNDDF